MRITFLSLIFFGEILTLKVSVCEAFSLMGFFFHRNMKTHCLVLKRKKLCLHPRLCGAPQVALMVENLPANAGDMRHGFNPWVRKIPLEEETGNLLQYSCLENPMDRGTWWATVHRVTKSWIRLNQLSTHAHASLWSGGKWAVG